MFLWVIIPTCHHCSYKTNMNMIKPVWWVQLSQTWWRRSFRYGLQTSTSRWGWLSPEVEAVDTPGSLSYTALLQQGWHQSRMLVNNCSSENTSLLGAARLHPSKQILYSSSQQAQEPCKQLLQWEYLTFVEWRSSDMTFLAHGTCLQVIYNPFWSAGPLTILH
jgi:hypothetical protein